VGSFQTGTGGHSANPTSIRNLATRVFATNVCEWRPDSKISRMVGRAALSPHLNASFSSSGFDVFAFPQTGSSFSPP
jgi:hypothetical protein